MNPSFRHALLAAAAEPYRRAGKFAWYFARNKLAGDPAFFGILQHGAIPDCRRLVDLGCGQGLLVSWLREARSLYESGQWDPDWPPAPKVEIFHGVELMPSDVARARAAVGHIAEIVQDDMRTTDLGRADAVVVLDVLHYIGYADQEKMLQRIRAALPPGGVFLTRIGDAAAGLPFKISNWVDHTVFFIRGHRPKTYCRSLAEWQATLAQHGFSSATLPMSQGTPFANVMLIARAI